MDTIEGLSTSEQKIFKEVLRLGQTSAGRVTKNLGFHKGTVYNSLRRLEEKGLIGVKEDATRRIYSINSLSLRKRLAEEKEQHEKKVEGLKKILHAAKQNEKADEGKVLVLSGVEGFKTFFDDLYSWAYQTKKEYYFMGKGNEMVEHLGEDYYQRTQIKKKRLKLRCRVILNNISRRLPVKKHVVGNVRYLEMDYLSPVSTWMYGNTTVIVLWGSTPLQTIVIHSKGLTDSYRSFFENMWKMATP
ncbi:TPA: hypothetical protein HA245_01795 [Candidatus Woesearchaeota archaeon]|nr:hypothetical protein [Candidatus Woesearchaeota archaeon]HIH49038.1 hypothetical protein [Candidatus Woesearchaeota archaeon]HIJ03041.1 hypothetical protein [Candidatus Woesearchaeota archaeon]